MLYDVCFLNLHFKVHYVNQKEQKKVLQVAFGKDFRHRTITAPSPAPLASAIPTN